MNTLNTTTVFGNTETLELGPNGYPVGYLANGDKVEWVPDDLQPNEVYPLILRRNDNAIDAVRTECWEKVWWSRNMVRLQQDALSRGSLIDSETMAILQKHPSLMRIANKYGLENLCWSDYEWGLLCGNLSALRWVSGAEWEYSLDT